MADEGMPKRGRGLYPLKACVQWYVAYWKDRALGREADTGKKRRQDLDTQILEAKLQEATGHLINRVEVVQVWSGAFMRLGKMLDGLPSSLGRELNWSTDTTRIVRARIDQARDNFVRDSGEFIEVTDDAGKSPKRA